MTAPTGTSPASAATAARSSARRIGWGSGKAMAGRALAGSAAPVMPARRGKSLSVGVGVGLRLLGPAHLDARHLHLGLARLHLHLGDRDVRLARADLDRAGLHF